MNVSPKCTACRICWFERVHTSPRDCAYHSSWPTPRQVTASAPSHKVITPCVAVSVIASHEAAPRTFSSASASVVYLLPKDHNYWCVRACVLYFCTADLLQTLPWAWCIFFFFFSCLEEECATDVTFVFPQVINLSCCCFNGIIYTVDWCAPKLCEILVMLLLT